MNAGATAERVHDAIRRMILNRELRAGARLDPAVLGEALSSSPTPVREALHLLCGAGLVEARHGGGFHVPLLDAPALTDLYAWVDDLIDVSLRSARRLDEAAFPVAAQVDGAAPMIGQLLEKLARLSGNEEHVRAMHDANARLHAARLVEPQILDGVDEEVTQLAALARGHDRAALRAGWRIYNRRRRRVVAHIARALVRG